MMEPLSCQIVFQSLLVVSCLSSGVSCLTDLGRHDIINLCYFITAHNTHLLNLKCIHLYIKPVICWTCWLNVGPLYQTASQL